MAAWYNENDPKAAAWLRELIKVGAIAPGEVDERDIRDVRPIDLRGFDQCHFFAGIGTWSYALRCAGWPDDRPVWTGSCPCQPFSAAGGQAGFDDQRHLWPSWHWLVDSERPSVLFGEQVASPAGLAWLDLVQADLEGSGYAVEYADLCAASVGAPHIRQRTWIVAESEVSGRRFMRDETQPRRGGHADGSIMDGWMADANGRYAGSEGLQRGGEHGQRPQDSVSGLVGKPVRQGLEGHAGHVDYPRGRSFALGSVAVSDAVGGFWRDAEVVYCRDGKLRPVEPGTFPLAHGAAARVGRLRGYGNSIVAPLATEIIAAYMSH